MIGHPGQSPHAERGDEEEKMSIADAVARGAQRLNDYGGRIDGTLLTTHGSRIGWVPLEVAEGFRQRALEAEQKLARNRIPLEMAA